MVEERRVELRALELAQEAVAEHLKPAEGHVLRHCQCVARSALVLVAVHDGDEAVGGGLGPDVLAWEVAAEEVPDERGLAHRVLSHEQYHWLRLEVAVREQRRVEVAEAVKLLDRAHLRPVQLLQPIRHAVKHFGDLLLPLRHGCVQCSVRSVFAQFWWGSNHRTFHNRIFLKKTNSTPPTD